MRAPPTFSGISRFMPLCPSTAQSIPGTAREQLAVVGSRRRRAPARPRSARRARAGRRPRRAPPPPDRAPRCRPPANAAASSGVGGAVTPKTPTFTPGGVDDPVGVEQPLAVLAVEVRRHQRDARLLGEPPQQRQPERQIALAREQRGRAHPPERRREQARAPLDLARRRAACRRGASRCGQEQIAGVEDQRRVRLGARAIDHRRPARDPAQRMHRAAALLVVAGQVRRVQQRDLLAPRRRRRGHGGAAGVGAAAGRALVARGRRRHDAAATARTPAAPAASSVAPAAPPDTGRKRRRCPRLDRASRAHCC